MSLAFTLARFVAGLEIETLPEEVLEKARACVLNGYGIALGSHTTDFFPVAARAVLAQDGAEYADEIEALLSLIVKRLRGEDPK